MHRDARFHAVVARIFVERLAQLSPEALAAIATSATPFDHYYQLALEMAVAATQRLAPAQRDQADAELMAQFPAIDALADAALPPGSPTHARIRALSKAAVRAILVRDVPDFGSAPFTELWGPFRSVVRLRELESEAKRRLFHGGGSDHGAAEAG